MWTHNGTRRTNHFPVEFAMELEKQGVGKVVLNAIDRDSTMDGYDLELIESMHQVIRVPITELGGAGSVRNLQKLVSYFGVIGAAAGSLFVFEGVYRAVLINYPSLLHKEAITSIASAGERR